MVSIVRKNVSWSVFATIIKNLFFLLTYITLARAVSPEDMGFFSIALVASGIAQTFIDSGFVNVVVRLPVIDNRHFSSIYWFCVFLGCSASLLLALSGYILSIVTNTPLYMKLFLVVSITGLVNSFGQFFFILLHRAIDFKSVAIIEIISSLITFLIAYAFLMAGRGVNAYFVGVFAGIVTHLALSFVFAKKHFIPSLHFRFADLKDVTDFGFYNTLERVVTFVSFNLEKPLIASLFSLEVLGYYTIVNQIVTRPLIFFSAAFSRVAYPMYAGLYNDHNALNAFYIKSVSSLALFTFPIYAILYMIAEPAITIIFGVHYLSAIQFMLPMCILGAIWSIGNPLGSYLMALNKTKAGFFLNFFIVILTSLLYLTSSPFGLLNMLWVWIAIQLFILIPIEFSMMAKFTRLHYIAYLKAVLPHALITGTLSQLAHYCATKVIIHDEYLLYSINVVLFCGLYIGYIYSVKKFRTTLPWEI